MRGVLRNRGLRLASIVVVMAVVLALVPSIAANAAGAAPPAGWTKIASKGIDNPSTMWSFPYKEFKGKVYFYMPETGGGPGQQSPPAPVWTYDGKDFDKAAADGFGDANNNSVVPGYTFQGKFYIGTGNRTTGGQLWRTADGEHWGRVGKGTLQTSSNGTCYPLGVQGGKLLVGFDDYPSGPQNPGGARVWSYDGENFVRANKDGFGLGATSTSLSIMFGGRIHVCALDDQQGISWPLAYRGGTTWDATGPKNFGDADPSQVVLLTTDGKYVYTGTMGLTGKAWRYDGSSWSPMELSKAIESSNLVFPQSCAGTLYISTAMLAQDGPPTGTGRLFRQKSDGSFELLTEGFGDPGNIIILLYLFQNRLLAGCANMDGFQVWSHPAGPYIDGIDPPAGPFGTRVEIKGSGFGSTGGGAAAAADASYISFNGAKVYESDVLSWSDSEIVLRVPDGATDSPVTVVTPEGVSAGEVEFEPLLARTYYFAEGTTRDNDTDGTYQEWICLSNPGDRTTGVDVTYMFAGSDAGNLTKNYQVTPGSRLTVDVGGDVGLDRDVSVKVDSKYPIAAERTIYFNYRNKWTGGSAAPGVPEPGEVWYFAEGSTRDNTRDGAFEEWLCLQNPNDTEAKVEVTYILGDGSTPTKTVTVPARGRVTRDVNQDVGVGKDVSIKVSCGQAIIAERPIYYDYHGMWAGGDTTTGARYPSQRLYLAEGCTYPWAQEWISILNPNGQPATVNLDYQIAGGGRVAQSVGVAASSRATVDVAAAVGADKDVSVTLESSVPVVVERAMYFSYAGDRPGGDIVVASSATRRKVYFAEGTTRDNPGDGSFDEWLSIANPNDAPATATLTFFRSDGVKTISTVGVGPKTRTTVSVNEVLGENMDASVVVESDIPVVVERPMYFDYHGFATGGHDSFGYGL